MLILAFHYGSNFENSMTSMTLNFERKPDLMSVVL